MKGLGRNERKCTKFRFAREAPTLKNNEKTGGYRMAYGISGFCGPFTQPNRVSFDGPYP